MQEVEIVRLGQAIAATIKASREAAGMSKSALAQKAGISIQAVAFIESATNSPSLATFLRISYALDTKPDLLLKKAIES